MTQRFERWIRASYSLARADRFMPIVAQQIGRLDVRLIEETPRYLHIAREQQEGRGTGPWSIHFIGDHLFQSHLWVLAAYELVRAVDQRASADSELYKEKTAREFKVLKHRIGRVRMPLAKFEASAKYRRTDASYAYPGMNTELGAVWQVSADDWVTRRELGDAMLEICESALEKGVA